MAFKAKKSLLTSIATIMLAGTVMAACSGGSENPAAGGTDSGAKPSNRSIKILLSHNNSGFASKGPEEKKNKYYEELSKLSGYKVSYEFWDTTSISASSSRFASLPASLPIS